MRSIVCGLFFFICSGENHVMKRSGGLYSYSQFGAQMTSAGRQASTLRYGGMSLRQHTDGIGLRPYSWKKRGLNGSVS
jgi:hypothetical protein